MRTLEDQLADVLDELAELGELWLEKHVRGHGTKQVDAAIGHATRESRKYEKKLRKSRDL